MNGVKIYKDTVEGRVHYTVYDGKECVGMFLGDEKDFSEYLSRADGEITEGVTIEEEENNASD
jgi:hypothetical protein